MFSSLDEQFKHDEATSSTPRERWLKYCGITLISMLVFGGLFTVLMIVE